DQWDDLHRNEAGRPRVMTYIRKGQGLKTQLRHSLNCRDLLWTDVNGYAILNAYRQ
ncbi:hypothetical protein P153DRAFT_259928, partial [Dothidotthia symphoricarpi CBS 119687]